MPIGKGRKPAPPGYLTAARTGELLGSSRMYKLAEAGRLHKHVPPGQKHGFYSEQEVQKIQAEDKAFYEEKLHKLPAHFAIARPSDMQSLYALATRIFGSSTISPETRAAWIRAEARGNYVLKRPDTNEVVAYFYMQALTHERIMHYLKECRGSTVRPEEIVSIEPGQPLELIIAGIGRDPRADKQYTAALMHGVAEDLASWGRKGIELSRLYAYSETMDGIYLSFSMGMELWKRPRYLDGEGPFFTFVLDVEKTDIPLLRPYKRAIAEYRRAHTPQQTRFPSMPAPTRQKAATTRLDALQPEGTITLQELADLLGMPRRSLLEQVTRRNLEHIAIPHPSRAGEMKRYFTPAQADLVRQALGK